MGMEDTQHLLPSIRKELLRITRVSYWLFLLSVTVEKLGHIGRRDAVYVLQTYVAQAGVRDIANEDPPDFEDALPFVGRPDRATPSIVNLPI